MMKIKKCYISPLAELIVLDSDGLCDVIIQSGPSDDFAKENKVGFDFEDEENTDVRSNSMDVWDDKDNN